tara:strand:- start:478 stop:822 length:345 start_codon:yes stop_codon:yes gene_type:complete
VKKKKVKNEVIILITFARLCPKRKSCARPPISLDISAWLYYISTGDERHHRHHNLPEERIMRHRIIIQRAIRDDKGRFTGLYRSSLNIPTWGRIPKTFAILQLIVLATVFYFNS